MGLTNRSGGRHAIDNGLTLRRESPNDRVVALAGNPNVGKSTVFNGLTGMNQHTGNWPGKTVCNAQGRCATENYAYIMVDIPGTYSLMAHSAEEEVARDFLCFGEPDAVVVVCDATCLERNLNLVLQTMEITSHVILCLNLMDEAKRKGITIRTDELSRRLGVPVVETSVRDPESLRRLLAQMDRLMDVTDEIPSLRINYTAVVESALARIEPQLKQTDIRDLNSRWLALRLLENDEVLLQELCRYLGKDLTDDAALSAAMDAARRDLQEAGITEDGLKDQIVSALVKKAEELCRGVVLCPLNEDKNIDRRIDRLLTGKWLGYPLMLLLLAVVFWITITGANYPSQWLNTLLFGLQDKLTELFYWLHAPEWLHGIVVLGMYRVLAWVVSVMLPPMAIFFPLFTLLEDVGYLPRVAYNLDRPFKRCHACGKQALTMCMGFGCNAAGVVGCRIIDSPRERLLAILTNNFVPCNGRFPTLIAILTMFFVGTAAGAWSSMWSAILLTAVILLGILITFGATRLLSVTLLKGVPSSFTLEMPPYRKPQIGKVIVRSIYDRTLFVLGRAVVVAIPAGALIWLMANVTVGDATLLSHCASALDPFARLMGLDGVILMAFILGFPANEIVIPIAIMAYLSQGTLQETAGLAEMRTLLVENGWNWVTALCTMLFSLMHWPCSTTVLTIHKETGSAKWTAVSVLLPTLMGIAICMAINGIAACFGY